MSNTTHTFITELQSFSFVFDRPAHAHGLVWRFRDCGVTCGIKIISMPDQKRGG